VNDLKAIAEWKLQGVGPWRIHTLRSLSGNDPSFTLDVTRRAFRSDDDLAALLLLEVLSGIGASVASAILMAQNPDRYTVADRNAWTSLVGWEHFAEADHRRWEECWLDYLRTCRTISESLGVTLRDLDRALWCANGRTELP
jgi:hypothetical protein